MPAQAPPKRRKAHSTRRTFLVRDQLRAKLGDAGFVALYDRLKAAAK